MNKRLMILTALFAIPFILSCNMPLAAQTGRVVGIANETRGVVENYHEGMPESEVVQRGGKVYVNDRIVTGEASKVQIIFRDDSVITLSPNSELVIDANVFDQRSGRRESVMSLLQGKIRSVVGEAYSKNNSKFEIHTRTATAGVRGTENIVESVANPPGTNVYGIRNTTYVHSNNDQFPDVFNLGPKKGARVPPDTNPELFDFDFEDRDFMDLIGETTIPGTDDVEQDIEAGAFDLGLDDIDVPDGQGGEPEPPITPPFEQDPSDDNLPEPTDDDNHEHRGGYDDDYYYLHQEDTGP